MDLVARLTTVDGQPKLDLTGEIDLATLPVLHDHLGRALSLHAGTTLMVDVNSVLAIDDSGLGVLLGAAGRCRKQGGELVVLCAHNPRLLTLFEITGFDKAVEVRRHL